MTPVFDLYTKPPGRETVDTLRDRLEKLLPRALATLMVLALFSGLAFISWWDRHPQWQAILMGGFIVMGALAAFLIWQAVSAILRLTQLTEAHPETANAYLAAANNTLVKAYCHQVVQQGRPLTMGEADMLLKQLTTRDEIIKLAAYYDKHAPLNVWPVSMT